MFWKEGGVLSRRGAQRTLFVWNVRCSTLLLLIYIAGLRDNLGMWLSQDFASPLRAVPAQASEFAGSSSTHTRVQEEEEPEDRGSTEELMDAQYQSRTRRGVSSSGRRTRAVVERRGHQKLIFWLGALITSALLGLSFPAIRDFVRGLQVKTTAASAEVSPVETDEGKGGESAAREPTDAAVVAGRRQSNLQNALLVTVLPAVTAMLLYNLSQLLAPSSVSQEPKRRATKKANADSLFFDDGGGNASSFYGVLLDDLLGGA